MREFINGAEAVARGALRAGCDFFAGYPITPATPILLHMVKELPKVGGVAIQAEDEIAALGMCIGAVLTGSRAMTATSGAGISLFSENIGAAIMLETPLVIVDVQRMGPATGGSTTSSQDDIQFLRWGTSGGYPVIVLSPKDAAECYTVIQRAFDLSERFRTPVFVAIDKEISLSAATINSADFIDYSVRERAFAPRDKEYIPNRFDFPAQVLPMAPFGGPHPLRVTTSAHDERGYLTKDQAAMERFNQHLIAKIDNHLEEITLVDADLQDDAEILFISYGVTACAVGEAIQMARDNGKKVSALTITSLWPVPSEEIRHALSGVKRVAVVEMNLGLYRREIECLASEDQEVIGINRLDGNLVTPDEILVRGGLR